MPKLTPCEYGRKVLIALMDSGQTQTWLVEEVHKDTGLYFDARYLHKILCGKSTNQKIMNSISNICRLEEVTQ